MPSRSEGCGARLVSTLSLGHQSGPWFDPIVRFAEFAFAWPLSGPGLGSGSFHLQYRALRFPLAFRSLAFRRGVAGCPCFARRVLARSIPRAVRCHAKNSSIARSHARLAPLRSSRNSDSTSAPHRTLARHSAAASDAEAAAACTSSTVGFVSCKRRGEARHASHQLTGDAGQVVDLDQMQQRMETLGRGILEGGCYWN